jgi:hypothetical protein
MTTPEEMVTVCIPTIGTRIAAATVAQMPEKIETEKFDVIRGIVSAIEVVGTPEIGRCRIALEIMKVTTRVGAPEEALIEVTQRQRTTLATTIAVAGIIGI